MLKLNPDFEKFIEEQKPQVILAIKDTEDKVNVAVACRVSRQEGEAIINEFVLNHMKEHVQSMLDNLPF